MMVGHQVAAEEHPPRGVVGAPRLVVKDLHVMSDRATDAVRGVSFEVSSGELVGIAGVAGNGQRELAEAIAGLRPPVRGSIRLNDREMAGHGPAAIRSAGLGYVPEERMRDGVVGDFSVAENLLLVDYGSSAYSQLGFLRRGAIRRHCQELVADFNVKTPNLETPARSLSGGNIQKLIMARELSAQPQVLLVAQPTRGIDVSASLYIHQRLVAQRDSGTATIIISEDLDEVMTISDRILVMYEGTIIGSADPRTATREEIGMLMAGVRPSAGQPAAAAPPTSAANPPSTAQPPAPQPPAAPPGGGA
jgi:simple sugar transport system ATP-binding protein